MSCGKIDQIPPLYVTQFNASTKSYYLPFENFYCFQFLKKNVLFKHQSRASSIRYWNHSFKAAHRTYNLPCWKDALHVMPWVWFQWRENYKKKLKHGSTKLLEWSLNSCCFKEKWKDLVRGYALFRDKWQWWWWLLSSFL